MKAFLLFISFFISYNSKCQNYPAPCNYRQTEFDSDTCCWRQLSKNDSFIQAGNLIIEYLDCDKGKENSHSLNWHAGQMFAYAGMNKEAKRYFKKTYNIFSRWFGGKDGSAWYFYAKGTVAFLDKRKNKLQRIIHKWDRKLPKDRNYQVLVKLYNNIGNSYYTVFRK